MHQACILSPCSFNLYAEYMMQNAGPEHSQAGIKIAGRNINSLRYADDATLMAESKEELTSLLSPGEPGMQPRDPCLPWRGILGPGHTPR